MHTKAASWDDARKTCIQEGTHLLILNSGAEVDAVKSLWLKHPNFDGATWGNHIFIGAHDRFTEGDFVTLLSKKHCQRIL
jgi:hypothetical protein